MIRSSLNPFKILRKAEVQSPEGAADTAGSDEPIAERIGRMVRSAEVFVFMKGNPARPRCGFSANTVAILDSLAVPYSTFDVLADEQVRAGAKAFADWPTFPQVYLRGELIGGNDIVTEMHHSGELRRLLEEVAP